MHRDKNTAKFTQVGDTSKNYLLGFKILIVITYIDIRYSQAAWERLENSSKPSAPWLQINPLLSIGPGSAIVLNLKIKVPK